MLFVGAALVCTATPANADPTAFGGHSYEVVLSPGISWETANAAANGSIFLWQPGHLATITSAAEDAFLDTLRKASTNGEVFVGGFQQPGSAEPGGGWTWVNGEGGFPGNNAGPVYANWLPGEPNNVGSGEAHLAIGLGNNFGWNDEGNLNNIVGYVVEWDTVPEPAILALIGVAGLALAVRRRKKRAA